MKKKILISAAGTASAFHLAEVIRTQFESYCELHLCDTNPRHLVAAAAFSDAFLTVPPANDPSFRKTMLDIFDQQEIDIYVPLIDVDVYAFPSDDPELALRRVRSIAPPKETATVLRSKQKVSEYLNSKAIPTPRTASLQAVLGGDPQEKYFVKPDAGWGSRGVAVMDAEEIRRRAEEMSDGILIQELCIPPEITIEVFNGKEEVKAICRERLETKCGVCTKARIWRDEALTSLAKKLCRELKLPTAFCFQVMKNEADDWVITDLNPRLGAGTALSTACGWQLVKAALISWLDLPMDPADSLKDFEGNRFAVRAYREIQTQ